MFRKHRTLTHIAQGIAIAAVVAAVAVPSALAGTSSGERTRAQACQTGAIWITVTDDLGLSQLVQVAQDACTAEFTCTASAQPGWVSVTDDLGVPSLVPSGQTVTNESCVLSQSPLAPASKKITRSRYPGWVLVAGENGSSSLVSRSDVRGS